MTNYSELRHAGKLNGTIKAAKIKRKVRDELRFAGHVTLSKMQYQTGFIAIPLGERDDRAVNALSRKDRPRVCRWVSPEAETRRSTRYEDGTVQHSPAPSAWRVCEDEVSVYGGPHYRNFRMIDYTPTVASYGRATATRLYASIWAIAHRYRAPRGWTFGTDYLGIYLVRVNERRDRFRYHLTSDDIRGGLAAMRRAALNHEYVVRETARIQRATVCRQKADAIRLRGIEIWVGLEDSSAVGNCRAGTVTWAARQGLDHGRHHRASVIERFERSHSTVGAVIDAARRRTLADLDRGFCHV